MVTDAISKKYLFSVLNAGRFLSTKRPEDLTNEDLYILGKRYFLFIIRSGRGGSALIEVASKIISNFQKTVQSENIYEWQILKTMGEFLLKSLLPSLYNKFHKMGIDFDFRMIFENAINAHIATDNVKRVARLAWKESGMDGFLDGNPPIKKDTEFKLRPKFYRYRGDLIPAYLKKKKTQELTEAEMATMGRLTLFAQILSGQINSKTINAASKLIDNFQGDIKIDSNRTWLEIVKPLEEFFMGCLYHAVHRHFSLREEKIPIDTVFREVWGELTPKLEEIGKQFDIEVKEVSILDEAVKDVKRRGHWIKKEKKSIGSIVVLEKETQG